MKKYYVTISIIGGKTLEIFAKNKSDAEDEVFNFSDEEVLRDLDFSIQVEEFECIGK